MTAPMILSWCPGQDPPDLCDPCPSPPTQVGHLFFQGDPNHGGGAVILWEGGNNSQIGRTVNGTVNFTVDGTDANPPFSVDWSLTFPQVFGKSIITISDVDIGKPLLVGGVMNITISAHTTADYDTPFFPFNSTYSFDGGATFVTVSCQIYQLNEDGSRSYITWNANGG